ncbi:hypothetical protein [Stackebrandtia nassauensis]|uniref:hypothetical protein n=1 Tax=Stackebrandtia nassauensis TaxID=283811 RepID=UPI001184990E|nr:hypothetical protein [Stackebrandtia nassauensis]
MAVNDWLPLVTSIGGTAVGLGGVYATLRSGKRQQETALLVAREQSEHQARLAREERLQRRLEETYRALLDWAESVLDATDSAMTAVKRSDYDEATAYLGEARRSVKQSPSAFNRALWGEGVANSLVELTIAIERSCLRMIEFLKTVAAEAPDREVLNDAEVHAANVRTSHAKLVNIVRHQLVNHPW